MHRSLRCRQRSAMPLPVLGHELLDQRTLQATRQPAMHHVAASAVCSAACSVVHEGSSPAHGAAPAGVHRAARTPVRRVSFDAPPPPALCVVVGLQPVGAVVSKLTACDPALLVVQLLRKEHLCVVCVVQTRVPSCVWSCVC